MIDAAQNVLDPQLHEPSGGLIPRRIKRYAARYTSDHHRPTGFAERYKANSQLNVISEVGADRRLYRKHRFGRGDRINEMGVQIALLKCDDGVRSQWLGHLRDRPVVVFERAIREWREPAGAARRHKANIVLPELKSAGESPERSLDGGPRRVDLVVVPCERKRHAAQQIQRHADHKVRLARFDLDEAI